MHFNIQKLSSTEYPHVSSDKKMHINEAFKMHQSVHVATLWPSHACAVHAPAVNQMFPEKTRAAYNQRWIRSCMLWVSP